MGIGGATFSAPFLIGCASISVGLKLLGVVLGVFRSLAPLLVELVITKFCPDDLASDAEIGKR